VTRITPGHTPAPPAHPEAQGRAATSRYKDDQTCLRGQGGNDERHRCANSKAGGRRERSLKRTGPEGLGDAEFVAGMRAYGVMGHELVSDLFREGRIEAPTNVDRRQFLVCGAAI